MSCYAKRNLVRYYNNTTYSFSLLDYADIHTGMQYWNSWNYYSGHDLAVRIDGVTKYIPLMTDASWGTGNLKVRYNGATLYPRSPIPTVRVGYSDSHSDSWYNNVCTRKFSRRVTNVWIYPALSKATELQMSCDSGSSWVTVATIPANTYVVNLDTTLSYSAQQQGSAPGYEYGRFRFRLRSGISTTTITAQIIYNAGSVSALEIEAWVRVKLSQALPTGYIKYVGEWVGFGAPFYSTGSVDVLYAGSQEGSKVRPFVIPFAITGTCRIYYCYEGNETQIDSFTFVPSLNPFSGANHQNISFTAYANNPSTIMTLYGYWGDGSVKGSISQKEYW